jgi:hypothetical protein
MSADAGVRPYPGERGTPVPLQCASLVAVSRADADHLLAAVGSVAISDGPRQTRWQTAFVESVQHVWEKPCLTTELLARFRAPWDATTDPSAGPRSTGLRQLTAFSGPRCGR